MELLQGRKKELQEYAPGIQSTEYTGVTVEAVERLEQTAAYHQEYSRTVEHLRLKEEQINWKVVKGLLEDPGYQGARGDAVELAWEYEKAMVEMGGTGTTDWNREQRALLLDKGKVPGAEGHHSKNVAAHPEEQGNPDNIIFYKSRQEHLQLGHGGDFRNDTDGEFIDREAILEDINQQRVAQNEISGILAAAMLGFGVGGGIAFLITLAENGLTRDSFLKALKEGIKTGTLSGAQAVVGYGISRAVLPAATEATENLLNSMGLGRFRWIADFCGAGIAGGVVIAVFQIAKFFKLKKEGYSTKEALAEVGKQAGISGVILMASVVAGGIFGRAATMVLSLGITVVSLLGTLFGFFGRRREEVYIT